MSAPNYTRSERQARGQNWVDHSTPAPVLLVMLLADYGTESTSWSPETILNELHKDLGVAPSATCLVRALAACQLVSSDSFYKDKAAFNDMAVALTSGALQPGTWIPPNAAECALAITWALLLSPPDPKDEAPFDDDIRAYIGQIVKYEGILTPPDVLRVAIHDPEAMDKVRYDFADDPDMFGAIWETEKGRTDEINRYVKDQLRDAMQRISQLNLPPNPDGKRSVLPQRAPMGA